MRRSIILAIAGLAFLEGCGNLGNKPYEPPDTSKWKAPYVIEFDTKAAKPNPAGVTVPAINYTAKTKTPERRAALIVRLDTSEVKNGKPGTNQLILGAVDVPGTAGTLPANYIDTADKGLAKIFAERCLKGTVKITVALVRSSIKPDADDAEINAKRLSEWVPTQVEFKNPHPKC